MRCNHLTSHTRGIFVYALVASGFLSSVSLQDVDECSPRCWDPVQLNFMVLGATMQTGVANEEECKALCVNDGTCIGIDWDKNSNSCWFQMTPLHSYNASNVNHWSLANCTGDCVSYCWRLEQTNFHVIGGTLQPNISNENRCKLLCSNTPNCTGVDWDSSCFLLFTAKNLTYRAGVHHWDIKRNLGSSCQSPSSTTLSDDTSPTVSIASNTMKPIQNSTRQFEESTSGYSSKLTAGIIALAVLLGLCILIIFGLVINTIRIGRKIHQERDEKNIKQEDNYEGLQMAETNKRSVAVIYTDLVQGNPIECAYEQTSR